MATPCTTGHHFFSVDAGLGYRVVLPDSPNNLRFFHQIRRCYRGRAVLNHSGCQPRQVGTSCSCCHAVGSPRFTTVSTDPPGIQAHKRFGLLFRERTQLTALTRTACLQRVLQISCFRHFQDFSFVRIRSGCPYSRIFCIHQVRNAISSIPPFSSTADGKIRELFRIEIFDIGTQTGVNDQVNALEITFRLNPDSIRLVITRFAIGS